MLQVRRLLKAADKSGKGNREYKKKIENNIKG